MITTFLLLTLVFKTCVARCGIEYPCEDLDDLDCIRDYFDEHAINGCMPLPDPEDFVIPYSQVFDAIINSTVTRINTSSPSVLDGSITSFVVDRPKNLTVLTISYVDFKINVANATIAYYRPGFSPIYKSVSDKSSLEFLDITVYFNGIDEIDLRDSLSLVTIEGNLTSNTTPLDDSSNDAAFEPVFQVVKKSYGLYVRERLQPPQSSPYSQFFIQNKICNFGLPIPDRVV